MPAVNPYQVNSPAYYNPYLTTPYVAPTAVPPVQNQQQNGMIVAWVQGISGAKAYPLSPNTRAFLFDSEKDTFYVKTTDQSGMPLPIREFDYSEVIQETTAQDTSNFVTKEELEEALAKIKNDRRQNNGKSSIRGTNDTRTNGSIQ